MRYRSPVRSAEDPGPGSAREGPGAGQGHGEEAVLLITAEETLRDDVALIAAVVGVRLEYAATWPDAEDHPHWAAVMCSAESLPPTTRQAEGVLLLGKQTDQLWEVAAQWPGLRPVPLPQAERWLSEQLAAQAFERSQGSVVAAVSTVGGAGSTTFAYLCAAELAVRGDRPLLIDSAAGPGSGLADLVERTRGTQQISGGDLDWGQLSRIEGEISTAHLSAALPVTDGIAVLTGSCDSPRRGTLLPAAVAAARASFDVVIIDAGMRSETLASLGEQVEKLLVVTRASRRAAQAGQRLLGSVAALDAAVVVNRRASPGWGAQEVAETLQAPVVTVLAEQKWLARADDLSETYELLRSPRGASMIGEVLHGMGLNNE